MTPTDLDLLRCPLTGQRLRFEGEWRAGHAWQGTLRNPDGRGWPVRRGLPDLCEEAAVRAPDRFMRRAFYNTVPRLHDPAVRLLLPLFQRWGETEDQLREAYLDRLELDTLPTDRPARILEVSVGTGANLPRLRQRLGDHPVELWGLDLSRGMLQVCRRDRAGDCRLLVADAHALPFEDAAFDRVFHVGGINGFGDEGLALREMARVARPGTPIVVVDEQLDPAQRHSPLRRLAFWAVTFYDRDPRTPTHLLPPGAVVDRDEQLSRFFYGLTWHMPT